MKINLIVCTDNQYGIGKKNSLPWHYSKDLEHFKYYTSSKNKEQINILIMGNNTYNSIPKKLRPLKNRLNIILTKDTSLLSDTKDINILTTNILYFNNIINILEFLENNKKYIDTVWIGGGNEVYKQFLELKIINHIYLTYIPYNSFDCDVFFPDKFLKDFQLIDKLINYDYNKNSYSIKKHELQFLLYKYNNKEEVNYLNMIRKIINKGNERIDRTKIGTLSLFGKSFKYNIRNYRLPLFTHRRMFYRGIIEELLFFISGKTDTKLLEKKNINIWKGNTSREFLDSRNLNNLKEGDMGAGYSFQLRHFGAEYINAETSYINKGFDQLKYVIDLIKNDPYSRRILFSYWNPKDLNKVALPSCFVKNTLVLTKYGYKPIQNLTTEEIVYTHKGNWKNIKRTYKNIYNGTIYSISCKNNTKLIKTTEEHPFYVLDKTKLSNKPFWCKANELNKNHLLCMPINKNSIIYNLSCENSNTSKEITYEDCYFFGYYLKNGTYSNNNYYLYINNNDIINFNLHNKYLYKIKELEILNSNSNFTKYQIMNYPYYNYLKEFKNKRYNKKIPEWVINLPSSYLLHFVNGYNSNNAKKLKIYSNNVLYNLQRIYAKLKIYSSIIYKYNVYKYNILQITNKKYLFTDDYQLFPINKIIKKERNTEVYNIEVEDDNSYIVENITVHNCHILYQFYIDTKKNELSCSFYQRSSDFVLAANFNIVSAAILTFMLCHITGYKPGKIIHNIGDIHIYKNHIEETKKMLNNKPNNFPILYINDINKKIKNIEDFTYEHFKILLYNSYGKYNFTMAV